jgi:hypothetical protein
VALVRAPIVGFLLGIIVALVLGPEIHQHAPTLM